MDSHVYFYYYYNEILIYLCRMSHSHRNNGKENLKFVFFLNLSFTLIELIGGFLVNSISIMSDAVHDLGDSISLGAAWYLESKSERKSDKKFTGTEPNFLLA